MLRRSGPDSTSARRRSANLAGQYICPPTSPKNSAGTPEYPKPPAAKRLPCESLARLPRILEYYSTDLTVATTFSVVIPNFLNSVAAGALAPKPCIVT